MSERSISSNSRRKRNLDEVVTSTNKMESKVMMLADDDSDDCDDDIAEQNDTKHATTSRSSSSSSLPFLPIQKLQLEAIFYPKFENENLRQQHIRQTMMERCQKAEGYLEVTLKHSGSLLLWSGGTRFYSKNSTNNVFSMTGEILLRQHFVRAFWNDDSASDQQQHHLLGLQMYEACSRYLEEHRLTLSFEVVTAVLGDHGDRPKRDFLILTAVAQRPAAGWAPTADHHQHSFFFSTVQLVELAQRFRLPHNDCWMFASPKSVKALFQLYDSTRETGTASSILPALTACGAQHVLASLYPHEDFQGDILEGIVIRFVPFNNNNNDTAVLARLVEQAREIRAAVPSERPDAWQLQSMRMEGTETCSMQSHSRWTVNLRQVYDECRGRYAAPGDCVGFEAKLRQLLLEEEAMLDGDRHAHSDESATATTSAAISLCRRPKVEKLSSKEMDIPAWVGAMLASNKAGLDLETRRVAQLIEALADISHNVAYSVFRETGATQTRYICIVHVLHDQTFQKFAKINKQCNSKCMPLFRGFSFELMGGGDGAIVKQLSTDDTATPMETDATVLDGNSEVETLMLKMKFLPYMVRTFGCRNGLGIVRRGGPAAFADFTNKLLQKWEISTNAQLKWKPFFRAWAGYANDCLTGHKVPPEAKNLPPLSASNYLDHLEVFRGLFESSKLRGETESNCKFLGLVVIVALQRETARVVANDVAQQLGGARRINGVDQLNPSLMAGACERGRGLVCSASADEGFGPVRKLLKNFANFISVVLFQCSATDIAEELLPESQRKKLESLLKGWRKTTCARVIELPCSSLSVHSCVVNDKNATVKPSADFTQLISTLNKASDIDERPGLLVFFPAIPGCGKSSWVAGVENDVTAALQTPENGKPRNLVVKMGDKTEGKFWPLVKQIRINDRSCIMIADKNAPPAIWSQIGEICSATKAVPVPVLLDSMALRTTRVQELRKPDGTVVVDVTHLYPFSLAFLAVCISRVMDRGAGTHPGKLDSSTTRACMVVVKFFGFYRKLSADDFVVTLTSKLSGSQALPAPSSIELPFFASESASDPLPGDLEEVLVEAIQTQYGYDLESVDTSKADDSYLDDLEMRIRERIMKYRDFVLGLTTEEFISCGKFTSSLSRIVSELETSRTVGSSVPFEFVKLAAIDVNFRAVHAILLSASKRSEALSSFLDTILDGNSCDQVFGTDSSSALAEKLKFVVQTHVTLAHSKRISQSEMAAKFQHLSRCPVQLSAVAVLWSATVMALEVAVSPHTEDGKALPPSENAFVHITVWFQTGAKAFSSNELPMLCEKGLAQRVDFSSPVPLSGIVSLWNT